ncbi:MAG: hypothetical protein ACRDVE_22105 [Actinocrinis sp.]
MRQLAERGAQTWRENVLGEFDRRWRTEQAADTVLSDVPADHRDAMTDRFAQSLEGWHDQVMTVVDRYRGPIADQAWAVLAARNPRPTDHDLHDVAAADQLAAWAVAATAAHQESAAKIEGIGESIKAFPEVVGPLAGMRATLEAQFEHLREELAERIARTSRIRALIDTHPERDALLAAIGAELWTAQAAAADQLAQLAASESVLHRALHSMFDPTATDELMEEIMAVFNAHLPAAADTSAALGAHLETAAESTIGYFCNPVL